MLDNDLIRLNQKLNTVLQLRGKEILEESKKEIAEEALRQDQIKEEKKKFRYKKKED